MMPAEFIWAFFLFHKFSNFTLLPQAGFLEYGDARGVKRRTTTNHPSQLVVVALSRYVHIVINMNIYCL